MILNVRRISHLAVLAAFAAACGTPRHDTSVPAPACQTCHGGTFGNAAPPRASNGDTVTSSPRVGAHQAHLADSAFRKAIACDECHVVPASGTAHANGVVDLTFGTLATHGGAPADYSITGGTGTCSGVYCHGDTLAAGGRATKPIWNPATPAPLDCSSCHGNPPTNHLASATDCNACHPLTVKADGTIDVAGGHHINGVIEAPTNLGCDGCHGAPPDTGAHRAHVGLVDLTTLAYGEEWTTEDLDPTGAQGKYTFGCGSCHPKDAAKHQNGQVDVELTKAAGAAGGLRAKNGDGAAYAGGSCSGVYCHSSGQATPTYAASPTWTTTTIGCGDCHGNPPSYPNGGPDSGSANSHIFLNFQGSEGGHFAGLPGPTFHRSRHGSPAAFPGQHAAPMTCQTCHADTVDPTNVGVASAQFPDLGVFYLDTSITTRLGAGASTCLACHDGGAASPPQGTGKVRPLRHVNGRRDVVFDRRDGTDLPVGWWSSLGTSAPSRPYFTTGATFFGGYTLPTDAGWDMPAPPPAPGQRETLSFQLTNAAYDPASLTCSSVACHLGNGARWGQKDFEPPTPSCTGCHALQ